MPGRLSTAELAKDYYKLVTNGAVAPHSFDDRDSFPGDPDYDAYVDYINRMAARDGLKVETWSYFHLVYCFVASALRRPDGSSYHEPQLRKWHAQGKSGDVVAADWADTLVRARRNARRRLA